jgi:allophanate hydrolase subunit 2
VTLLLTSLSGLCTVQDLGRPGLMHMGIPGGGALVPELCARANLAARNDPSQAAIEVLGALSLRAQSHLTLGTDDGHTRELHPGETFVLPPSPHVHYVAVRGGISVPVVLGGRGTLLVARLGGHHGRPLAKGDVLEIGKGSPCTAPLPEAPHTTSMLHVLPGPDAASFEGGLAALTRISWRIGLRRDRTGVQLVGGHLHRTLAASTQPPPSSAPMVRGALQVPPSGEPIVLGPDHPTTGGYPVIAVLVSEDLGAFFARPTHAHVALTQALPAQPLPRP